MRVSAKHVAISLFGIFFVSNGYAACNDTPGTTCIIEVSAEIVQGCSISQSAQDIDFGTLDFGLYHQSDSGIKTASLVQDAVVIMKCTPGVQLELSIDGGQNYQERHRLRHRNTKEFISYQLYRDSARQQQFIINEPVKIQLGPDGRVMLPLYGEVDLSPDMRAGVYEDKITITIKY